MPVPDIDKQVPTGQGRTVNAANDKKKVNVGAGNSLFWRTG